ncbi:MAG: hypothetical protein O2973_04575 [Gemmatimonadetes bacterium]|nr:hypothetical protein [Gemmatimonadota bacterium]
MLTIHQPRLFSRDLMVYEGDNHVAEIRHQTFSSVASIHYGGREYGVGRAGWFSGAYELSRGDSVIVSAEPVGFWRRRYEITAGTNTYELRRKSGWFVMGREFADGDSVVGSIERKGLLRSQTIADLPASVEPLVQVFVVWLANVLWQQDQSAAAAG